MEELCMISIDDGETISMGGCSRNMSHVNVHPDGTRIAFTDSEREIKIWVMENFLPPMEEKHERR